MAQGLSGSGAGPVRGQQSEVHAEDDGADAADLCSGVSGVVGAGGLLGSGVRSRRSPVAIQACQRAGIWCDRHSGFTPPLPRTRAERRPEKCDAPECRSHPKEFVSLCGPVVVTQRLFQEDCGRPTVGTERNASPTNVRHSKTCIRETRQLVNPDRLGKHHHRRGSLLVHSADHPLATALPCDDQRDGCFSSRRAWLRLPPPHLALSRP